MTQILQDPVFGQLEFNDLTSSWSCELPVPPCLIRAGGVDVFYLSFPESSLETQTLWLALRGRPATFSNFLEQAIFEYYQKNLTHFRNDLPEDEHATRAPELTRADQVWALLGLHTNVIKPNESGVYILVIGLEAKWRRDWGMDLVFQGNRLGIGEGFTAWDKLMHFDLPA
jgi:hypothetical protein